jgi:hypothetical protein
VEEGSCSQQHRQTASKQARFGLAVGGSGTTFTDASLERERGRQHRERREACVIPSKERAGTEALRLGPAELDVRCCE